MLATLGLVAGCSDGAEQSSTLGTQAGSTTEPVDTNEPDPSPTTPEIPCAQRVLINELQASNLNGLQDEDGDTPDWIELYNAEGVAVDLAGWHLSDAEGEPQMWELPAITLQPAGFLVVFASGKHTDQELGSWDTKIDRGHTWRYREVTAPVPDGWEAAPFNDSDWATGPSGFGRGDDDDATLVADTTHTVQVRTTFEVAGDELADLGALLLHVDYDDGFVAWLNGVEVARANVGVVGFVPDWDERSITDHEAVLGDGLSPPAFDISSDSGLLVAGTNTLALAVHDASSTSSDLSLVPFLTLGYTANRPGTPSPLLALEGSTTLHTNFKMRADGERVWLHDSDGCNVDLADPDQTWADQSFGREYDGGAGVGYFMQATPGSSNNAAEFRPGFADAPVFSPAPGFHPGGTTVTVTTEGDGIVHLLSDGYAPTEMDPVYADPLAIDGSKDASVWRARTYEEGLWPSPIVSATYFGRSPGSLAVVSLITDPPNLWDPDTGIYVLGNNAEDESPFFGANFWENWERPMHVAFYEPDGTLGFEIDGGAEIHGGYSRAHEQKSLRLIARSGYGDPVMEHEVFPGLGVTEFERLVLRNSGNDWRGCKSTGCSDGAMLRDALMHEITVGTDADIMASRPIETYINGEYWGLLNIRERPDAAYIESHHGVAEIDLIESWGREIEGSVDDYDAMMQAMRTSDMTDPAVYASFTDQIDVEQLINYLAYEIWFDNKDWPGNNIKFWRPQTPDGQWRWLLYDTDFGMSLHWDGPETDTLAFALDPAGPSWPNPHWATELMRLMLEAPEFQTRFINGYADLLNTQLQPSRTRALLADMAAEIAPVLPAHDARWGTWTDGVTTTMHGSRTWEEEIERVDEWLVERPPFAQQHILDNFGLAGTWQLSLDTDPPGTGTFELTAVEVPDGFTGTYFQGVPVTVTAVPAAGYSFSGWSGGMPATPTLTVNGTSLTKLTATFQ